MTQTPSTPGRIVIVGAGQSGGWAAHTLRAQGYAGAIVLAGDERWPPHERPPLSKSVLAGTAPAASTDLFKPEDWAALNIDWRAGQRVTAIDRAQRRVLLADGGAEPWDRLILCTGGRSRPLTLPGLAEPCLTLRSIDDALRLRERLAAARRLVVIGGGWIGLEVAATARQTGLDVTVIEAGSRLCERSLPAEVAHWLAALHRSRGVRLLPGNVVQQAHREPDGTTSLLCADGTRLSTDLVVAGIGMLANDALARAAGLDCGTADGSGIVVDAACRTSDPAIFAAGDVTISPNRWCERAGRLESWQNAQEQGIAAARAALGEAIEYQPLPWFWSDQYGLNLQIQGVPAGADQVVTRGDPAHVDATARVLFFYLRHGVLRGVIGLNAAREVRMARKLIESGKTVDAAALADATQTLTAALNKL